jgi:hypothetical protein
LIVCLPLTPIGMMVTASTLFLPLTLIGMIIIASILFLKLTHYENITY